jgi:hypothetical protein
MGIPTAPEQNTHYVCHDIGIGGVPLPIAPQQRVYSYPHYAVRLEHRIPRSLSGGSIISFGGFRHLRMVAHDEDGDDGEEVARGKSSGIQRRVKKEQPGGKETTFLGQTFHGHTFHGHMFHCQKFHGLRIIDIKPRESQSKSPWPVFIALNRKVLHFPWPQLTGMFNGPQGPLRSLPCVSGWSPGGGVSHQSASILACNNFVLSSLSPFSLMSPS